MKYGIVFLLLGLVCSFQVWSISDLWGQLFMGSVAICFIGVGLGFLAIGPQVFLKRVDGKLSLFSYILFWPYHLLNWLSLVAIGRASKENAMDEITPNLYLGRRLTTIDKSIASQRQFVAVLDLTSEFSKCAYLHNVSHYKCIPLLDTYAPTPAQLQEGVEFLSQHSDAGPVYVHCAMGHGRSATFVAAYLLAKGLANNPQEAEQFMKAKRPEVGLTQRQQQALENYRRTYIYGV